jgi:hypothetical protein
MAATAATPATFPTEMNLGGTALKAAGLVAADAQTTAVFVGKGKFRVVTTISAIEIASNDEVYIIDLEANTGAVTGTWFTLATLFAGGATEKINKPDSVVGTYVTVVENPYDYQVRVATSVLGSIATGINFTVDIYPIESNA